MNELLDMLAAIDKRLLEKIMGMKEPKYIEAIVAVRQKVNEAQVIIAKANK